MAQGAFPAPDEAASSVGFEKCGFSTGLNPGGVDEVAFRCPLS